jgi:tRNA-Thr(GGU) m(6)t(6)A37 methyltransferase TsaA
MSFQPFEWQDRTQEITFRPIGHVENSIDEPCAPPDIRAVDSRIVIDPALIDGLQGLNPGQQVLVVFYFDRSIDFDLCQHPQGNAERPKRGVFALRSPRRPNPIGITVVTLTAIDGNVLHVRGLDAINSTPVLDLKPA